MSGVTARFFMLRIGTTLGVQLAEQDSIAVAGSIATGFFELGFLFVFLSWQQAVPIIVFIAFVFHLSMFAILGISFWHLWILFPALFLIKRSQNHREIA